MLHAHSGFRLLIVLFLIIAILKSLNGWLNKKPFDKSDNIIALVLLSITHLQLIIGFVVFFTSEIVKSGMSNMGEAMKESSLRFWTIEHAFAMLLAIVLITIGRVKSKKASTDELKHKKGVIFYGLAFIIILWAGIIKPLALGRGWF